VDTGVVLRGGGGEDGRGALASRSVWAVRSKEFLLLSSDGLFETIKGTAGDFIL
jgi:hypothetical protein